MVDGDGTSGDGELAAEALAEADAEALDDGKGGVGVLVMDGNGEVDGAISRIKRPQISHSPVLVSKTARHITGPVLPGTKPAEKMARICVARLVALLNGSKPVPNAAALAGGAGGTIKAGSNGLTPLGAVL